MRTNKAIFGKSGKSASPCVGIQAQSVNETTLFVCVNAPYELETAR